jgi:hypothetical protein
MCSLCQVGPVKPILQLNREDARFIEAKDVLDGMSADENLAEMDWVPTSVFRWWFRRGCICYHGW